MSTAPFRIRAHVAMLGALLSLGCDTTSRPVSPPAPRAVLPAAPTAMEIITQAEGGPCIWLYDARIAPGEESRYRHPARLCRIQALREIAKGSLAMPGLSARVMRIAATARNIDTGDGILAVRTASLEALAAVADDDAALPLLVEAARTLIDYEARAGAATRATSLGLDPASLLDAAALQARDTSARPDVRVDAFHSLVAFEDERARELVPEFLEVLGLATDAAEGVLESEFLAPTLETTADWCRSHSNDFCPAIRRRAE